ncbi:MAG: type II CAAX endopeptidase family protein [Lapillicoccus sp.]
MTTPAQTRRRSWLGLLRATVSGQPVPRDHAQPDAEFRRRRIVAAVTLVIGGTLLGWSLRLAPGDPQFYLTTALLALCWVVGSLASGPLHLGYLQGARTGALVRPWLSALLVGLAVVALFAVGGLGVSHVEVLRAPVNAVLDHARYGSLVAVAVIALVNGVAEEIFFRGALFAAIGRRAPVVVSTAIYTLTTVAAGNAMLVFAALVLGLLVGLQRRITGGILAPIITHLIWSLGMLFLLPPIMG